MFNTFLEIPSKDSRLSLKKLIHEIPDTATVYQQLIFCFDGRKCRFIGNWGALLGVGMQACLYSHHRIFFVIFLVNDSCLDCHLHFRKLLQEGKKERRKERKKERKKARKKEKGSST
jgi:hypothetical protein